MTLIYEVDLDIVKMYLHNKNKVYTSMLSKVRVRKGHVVVIGDISLLLELSTFGTFYPMM